MLLLSVCIALQCQSLSCIHTDRHLDIEVRGVPKPGEQFLPLLFSEHLRAQPRGVLSICLACTYKRKKVRAKREKRGTGSGRRDEMCGTREGKIKRER